MKMMSKAEVKKVVRRVQARKGIPPRIDAALDAICEPFWKPLPNGGKVCDLPSEFLLDLALELLDQAGLTVETQQAVAKALKEASW